MSGKSYTQEQILSGIRIFWRESLGCESPFDPDASFVVQFNAERKNLFLVLDLDDVFFGLETHFGFHCPSKEWEAFMAFPTQDLREWEKTIAPRLTFRALADFIRERLNPIFLEPITMLGKPCLTAGIFRALEQLAEKINPKVSRFAPSTPIRARLPGYCLRTFWDELRWIMEDQLPPPPKIILSSRGFFRSLYFKLSIGLLIALWRRDLDGLLAGISVTFALFIPVGVIVAYINTLLNPLPEGIETFGDLARVLAAIILDQQSEAASCSTP